MTNDGNKTYSISEVSQMIGVAPTTLRYYDKEGLIPNVQRKNGIRIFTEMDVRWLKLLNCLKNTGMPIKRIKDYVTLIQQGDDTLPQRYELIKEQRERVQEQIDQLDLCMQELDFKDWYYTKAIELGSEKAINFDDYEKETGIPAPAITE